MELEVQYARSGGVSIAYHVYGDAPIDLVFITGFVSNIQYGLENPLVRRLYERISRFARVIRLDRRGTGLSDRPREVPTLETRMDDVRAVMDASGSERAVLLGTAEAAPMTALFAATYPERVGALVMHNGYAKALWSPDYPWARTREEWLTLLGEIEKGWGTEEYFDSVLRRSYPSVADDPEFRRWFINIMRYGASPSAALTVHRMAMDVDIRDILPAIRVPTLVLHQHATADHARYLEERIPNAHRIELPGADQTTWTAETLPDEIERFVGEVWEEPGRRRSSQRSCSPTSSSRPSGQSSSATERGAKFSHDITAPCAHSSTDSGVVRSTLPATASSRASTVLCARSTAPAQSSMPSPS